jgi:hypothetical protein
MGVGDPRRGLPADTASGQGQAFQVSGPNPGDRPFNGAMVNILRDALGSVHQSNRRPLCARLSSAPTPLLNSVHG